MFYVVKVTIEDTQRTEQIRPHETERAATIDYHNVIGGTITYDNVQVCMCMLIDDYGKVLKQERYERATENGGLTN